MPAHLVISRDHNQHPARQDLEDALAQAAVQAGLEVLSLPDLYHLPDASPLWSRLRGLPSPVVVADWLEARALAALLATRGVAAPAAVVSLPRCADAVDALAQVTAITGAGDPASPPEVLHESGPDRWYPVIDAPRCTNCHHCFQFCLFGVYELDEAGQVHVAQPDSCKHGCPACSRLCPASAIIFPLYDQDPAICGAPGCFVVPAENAAQLVQARMERKRATDQRVPVLDEIDDLISRLEDLAGEDAR
jgi:NAD-dependent dihydropyrimidine dehydrogenase PreA subunit